MRVTPSTVPTPSSGVVVPQRTAPPEPVLAPSPTTAPTAPAGASWRLTDAALGDAHVLRHPRVPAKAQLLVDKEQAIPDILAAIRGAARSIEVAEYIWHPTGEGRDIAEALRAKAKEGVEVSVLVDRQGSLQFPLSPFREYFDGLAADGVRVVRHNGPLNPAAPPIDHRKLFVMDGKVAYVGGMGLGKGTSWHDVMARLEGPVAAQAHAEFVGRWADSGGQVSKVQKEILAEADAQPVQDAKVGAMMLANSPGVDMAATEETLGMVRNARERVWVHTPYFGSELFADALVEAAGRGVDVRLAVTGVGRPFPLFPNLSRSFYPQLLDAGVKVIEQQTMSHEKIVLADDEASVGSTNITRRALHGDYELNVRVNEPAFVSQVSAMMLNDEARGRLVGKEELGNTRMRVLAWPVINRLARSVLGGLA